MGIKGSPVPGSRASKSVSFFHGAGPRTAVGITHEKAPVVANVMAGSQPAPPHQTVQYPKHHQLEVITMVLIKRMLGSAGSQTSKVR